MASLPAADGGEPRPAPDTVPLPALISAGALDPPLSAAVPAADLVPLDVSITPVPADMVRSPSIESLAPLQPAAMDAAIVNQRVETVLDRRAHARSRI
jgi:hypothetical protein